MKTYHKSGGLPVRFVGQEHDKTPFGANADMAYEKNNTPVVQPAPNTKRSSFPKK